MESAISNDLGYRSPSPTSPRPDDVTEDLSKRDQRRRAGASAAAVISAVDLNQSSDPWKAAYFAMKEATISTQQGLALAAV